MITLSLFPPDSKNPSWRYETRIGMAKLVVEGPKSQLSRLFWNAMDELQSGVRAVFVYDVLEEHTTVLRDKRYP